MVMEERSESEKGRVTYISLAIRVIRDRKWFECAVVIDFAGL